MFVQYISDNSIMNDRMFVTNFHLKECLNKCHLLNNRMQVTFPLSAYKHYILSQNNRQWILLPSKASSYATAKKNRMYVCDTFYEKWIHDLRSYVKRESVALLHVSWLCIHINTISKEVSDTGHSSARGLGLIHISYRLWIILILWSKALKSYISYKHRRSVACHAGWVVQKRDLMKNLPMANSMWVTLQIFLKNVQCIFLYDWQNVSEIRMWWNSLITSFPVTNREWVTFLLKIISSSCPVINREWVTLHDFVKGDLITSFPMINRELVTLHILWKAVWSHLFIWPTACEWHFTFWWKAVTSEHLFLMSNRKWVVTLNKGSLITSFPLTNRKWVALHTFVKGSTSFCMSDRLWVAFHILWKAVWSHLFIWPTASEWYCTLCARLSHHNHSYV